MQAIEIEVKFRVRDPKALEATLPQLDFHCETPRTFERNILFDTPTHDLRASRQILRLRRYGNRWVLTHKQTTPNDSPEARHKERIETETAVEDGEAVAAIFRVLGYTSAFVYEKWRSEWSDGTGHCVIDDTPIGEYAELEGPREWIDRTLAALHVEQADVTILSYGRLFELWQQQTGSPAQNMSFAEIQPALAR
ncbi:MAG TPA: class IV adenylate cyclase [Acidobacteriaceae bacterium]